MKSIGFLSGKIKQYPEDFIVNEIVNIKITSDTLNPYYVYRLTKREWNTHDILIKLAKSNQIPFKEIQFGGRKDRYGITTQYITSKKKIFLNNIYKNKVQLEYLGTSKEPMGSKKIIGNEFIITIRDVSENDIPKLIENTKEVQNFGFINYYDSQRFSTFSISNGIPFFYLIEKRYLDFIKFYLTNSLPVESKEAKDRKFLLLKNWNDWKHCLEISKTKIEKKIFEYLLKNKDTKKILRLIPSEEVKFMFSIFQAYVWNLSIVEYLKNQTSLYYFKTRIGYLGFTKQFKAKNKFFPLLNKESFFDPTYSEFFKIILKQIFDKYLNSDFNEVFIKQFLDLKIKDQTFAKSLRNIQILPENFKILEIKDDDNQKNKKIIKLKFVLESGCYATMLIKRLMARI